MMMVAVVNGTTKEEEEIKEDLMARRWNFPPVLHTAHRTFVVGLLEMAGCCDQSFFSFVQIF